MSTIDEIMDSISGAEAIEVIDELLVIDPNTRQINIPSAELTFGVVSDTHSERKYFQCPRIVGDNIDLTSCFIRVNYRNANGEVDAYLVDDVRVVGDNIVFSWELHRKVTAFAGQVKFVVCACRPGGKGASPVEWHTTQANGVVLAGVEPDGVVVENETADVISQLLALVESQGESVLETGKTVRASVEAAAEAEKTAMVNEIEAKGTNTLASIPDDYTALGAAVDTIERGMAPGIVCSVEGDSVVVTDASGRAVQGLRVFGRSTQDGVPSPDTPVEIESVENPTVTVCGKNLVSVDVGSKTVKGITYTVNEDKSITADGTATENAYLIFNNSVFLKAGVEYTLTGCPTGGNVNSGYHMYIESASIRDIGAGVTFTLDSDLQTRVVIAIRPGTTVSNITFYPMLRYSWQNDNYEPYVGSTIPTTHSLHGIPVSSGGNYTDSDGQQWICDEVDLERGVYVKRIGTQVYDGSADENWEASDMWYHIAIRDKRNNRTEVENALICSHFKVAPSINHFVGHVSETYYANGNVNVLFNFDGGESGIDHFKTWLKSNPITIQYLLATPIETPLSETEIAAYRALRTNKPNTTVLNDAGAWMNVEYVADTKLYIDNKIAALVRG